MECKNNRFDRYSYFWDEHNIAPKTAVLEPSINNRIAKKGQVALFAAAIIFVALTPDANNHQLSQSPPTAPITPNSPYIDPLQRDHIVSRTF